MRWLNKKSKDDSRAVEGGELTLEKLDELVKAAMKASLKPRDSTWPCALSVTTFNVVEQHIDFYPKLKQNRASLRAKRKKR